MSIEKIYYNGNYYWNGPCNSLIPWGIDHYRSIDNQTDIYKNGIIIQLENKKILTLIQWLNELTYIDKNGKYIYGSRPIDEIPIHEGDDQNKCNIM